MALTILLMFPVFLYWLKAAKIKPDEKRFLVKPESRKLYENFKRKQKIFALLVPTRKFLMGLVIVMFQQFPIL